MLTSVGLEHEGHEVFAVTIVVNLAVDDNIVDELSVCVDDVIDVGVHCADVVRREGGPTRLGMTGNKLDQISLPFRMI